MTDKLVTHDDLGAAKMLLRILRSYETADKGAYDLAHRIVAAAEADQPPLPEGWVLHTTPAGSRAVFWHRDGYLHQWDDDDLSSRPVQPLPSSTTTPLRPTVTEAAFIDALDAFTSAAEGMSTRGSLRAAFEAVGIEVKP